MSALSCSQLVKIYGTDEKTRVCALCSIDIEVPKGEILMIMGPSGSGKTTLLSVVSGILKPTGGQCLVFGENLYAKRQAERTAIRGARIGFVFQTFNLVPMLSACENVAIPLILNGMKREEACYKAEALLTRVGLQERMHVSPKHLSGGEQQRVAICRGFIHSPSLIVCDEPTSALDHDTGRKTLRVLQELAHTSGATLIIVTHDARILDFADRIVRMEDGKITGVVPH